MKRTLITFAVILAGLFVLLSSIDKSEYLLEKRFWHLQKKFLKVAQDPVAVPGQEFENLAEQYRQFINKRPDSMLAGQAFIQIGKVYYLKKDFEKARAAFSQTLEKYPKNGPLNAEALFNIGLAYENEGNHNAALEVYQQVMAKYPLTDIGLNVPLYLANYHLRRNMADESQKAFDRAIGFYQKTYTAQARTPTGYLALRLLATTYLARQEWVKGIETMGKLLLEYPATQTSQETQEFLLVKTINAVAIRQLKDYELPINIYQSFITKYPQHPFSQNLRQVVEEIRSLKDEQARSDISRK